MSNNRIQPRSRHEFNIALICALPLEASIVSALFDVRYDAEKYGKEQVDTNAYSLGALGSHHVVLVHMPNMGKVAAAASAAHLRTSFPGIQLALVVGICGGAPFGQSELLLGDVVISEGLVQYDLGRRLPNTFVRKDTLGENLPRPRPEVRTILAKLKTTQSLSQLHKQMLEHLQLLRKRSDLTIPYPGPKNDQLFEPNYLHRHIPSSECAVCANIDGDESCFSAIEASCEELGCAELDPRPRSRLIQPSNEPQPVIHFGLVATGDTVMRSGKDRDKIAARDKVIAFEMEGAGVWETFPAALVIKGVCDYADSHKNKSWQSYAAATAAAAAKAFLNHWDATLSVSSSVPGSVGHQKATQLEARQLDMMKRLYTSPYRDRKERNPDRVAGTCQWFTQHQLFKGWKASTSLRLLWVSADPGCGKSVLVKYLVDSILLTTRKRTVCYFFFKDDFEDQKSITSALCCILYQLFLQNPILLSESIANQFEAGGERLLASFSELWHILLTAAQDVQAGEILCILDAIDECEDHGRAQLTKELCKLYGPDNRLSLNLKFLVTSRPFGKIRQAFQPLQIPNLPIIHLSGESEEELGKISAEIDTYINARVQDIGQRLKLEQKEQHTLLKELLRVSNRTYLWAYLILDLVESDINIGRDRILHVTAHIPKTVDEAYDRILAKSYDPREATKILHIIVAAERALTLAELGFALAIRSHHRSSHEIDIKSDDRLRENVRDTCGLFVTIIHSKVYLLHQTAREFLIRNTESRSNNPLGMDFQWKHLLFPQESHRILASICIWYLLLSDHDEESLPGLSKDDEVQFNNSRVLLDYSATYWATHLRESHMEVNETAAQLLYKLCDTTTTRCKVWLGIFWEKENTAYPEKFTTLMVASYFGIDAVVKMILSSMTDDVELNARDETYERSALSWAAANNSDVVVKLLILGHRSWFRAITLLLLGNNAEVNSADLSNRTPLFYAIWNGNVNVVETLLEAGARVDVTDNIGGTPLFYAMSYRREAIVKLLLENGAVPKSDERATLLFFSAVEKSDTQVVQLFLDSGIDIDARNSHNMTPLLVALGNRDLDTIKLLLDHGANTETTVDYSCTPLLRALEKRDMDIVHLLLAHRANTEATSGEGDTPLLTAVKNRDMDIIHLMLSHGANIEATSRTGHTPLLTAIKRRDFDVIQLLLDRGANIETASNNGHTPLLTALRTQHLVIIQLLLDRGASIEAPSEAGNTPLITALKIRDPVITRLLLDRGANIEAYSTDGDTPLIMALQTQDMDNIQLLLDRGADIEAASKDGDTPLITALKTKDPVITQLLLDHGANVKATSNGDYPPLFYALEYMKMPIVEALLNRGANIGTNNSKTAIKLMLIAAKFGYLDAIQFLLDQGVSVNSVNDEGHTPLLLAAENEESDAIQFLLKQGAKVEVVDRLGRTPLSVAADVGYTNAIRCLLDLGANIETKDVRGATPLFIALKHWRIDSIKLLLDAGADIAATDRRGNTPLTFTASTGNCDVIKLLLDMGADIEAKNQSGQTAIICAVKNKHFDAVQLLLRGGAQVNVVDIKGKPPLYYAMEGKNRRIVSVLLEKGADIRLLDVRTRDLLSLSLIELRKLAV